MAHSVRVGVEWVGRFHHDGKECDYIDLPSTGPVAEGFYQAMGSFGHDLIFNWGNDNAWSSDFDHPDFGGNSLNRIDNVHFCYFAGHGGQGGFEDKPVMILGFSTQHSPLDIPWCISMSAQWRLGVKRLKWLVQDSCMTVKDTDPNHILAVWGGPMQGIHLILGVIELQSHGPFTRNRRISFAFDICRGRALANAWLDRAYAWDNPRDHRTRPIAIAAGVSRADAINRRENETLGWLYSDVASTNWLAWKWRS
jgi:hypothetical protein